MAKREELRLDVKVTGEQSIEKVANTLEDVEDILKDVESASSSAAAKLVADANKEDAALRQAAAAAEALKAALGESADKFDVDKQVGELNKLGVGFDEIEADAEQLAAAMKRVDNIEMRRVNDGITTTRQSMGQLRDSSDQSRSVLANLAGNAAQDLGELGGVVGSLGVGIGQMAEYAVDGNIALANLAKVAGPMAGLSAALLLVQHVMGGIAKQKAFDKAQVEDYTEVIRELGEGADAVLQHLEEASKVEFAADSGLLGFGTTIKDITGLLDQYGITAGEVARVIAGTEDQQRAWFDALAASGVEVNDQAKIMEALRQAIDAYGIGLERAERVNDVFGSTLTSVNAELQSLQDPLETMPELWKTLIEDVADGTFNFENAAAAIDTLADATNLSEDEIIALAKAEADLIKEDLAQKLEDDAAAAEEAAEAARELAAAIAEVTESIADINVDDIDNMAGALQSALDVTDQPLNLEILKGSLVGAIDELQEIVDEQGSLDWNTALAGVRDQFQEGIVESFRLGGRPAAEAFVADFVPQLKESSGLTEAEIYELVGIPGGDVEAVLRLVGAEESKADAERILAGLKGVDPNNPIIAYIVAGLQTGGVDPVIAEIASLLLAQEMGVPVAPELLAFTPAQIASAETVLTQAGLTATVETEADPEGAVEDIGDVEDGDYQTTIDADADTAKAARLLLAETSKPRTAHILTEAHTLAAESELDGVAALRTAQIRANALTAEAEAELNETARNRTSTVTQRVVRSVTTVGGSGPAAPAGFAAPMAAPMAFGAEEEGAVATLAAPMVSSVPSSGVAVVAAAPAPVVNHYHTTVQAGVVGNKNELDRIISRALRRHARLNGSRN